ncbi:hypothetical protein AUR64_02775 [Haloprofundus marisrubri]|uniref:Blue (type 1) copper domain-containing protein n=1 Tax=Haloprofundus marisrubri TaxID=1514971 RepID=A0A0W1R390_9EURY|nr:halocyanin domain-containing protein [Haloprofundus marisrubri]KTG07779.1 hypothetical protein AUR64_02775 [Haloprofundus marisrubri]
MSNTLADLRTTRRAYLKAAGAVTLGLSVLAGCSARGAPDSPSGPLLASEPAYGDWFSGVDAYEGTFDMREQSSVTVTVGAKDRMGYFSFDPAAVAVSPGTTITWEWSGEGGGHDVVELDGRFSSGALADHAGHTFSHVFDDPGIYPYYCTPHRAMGMRGAVYVLA